MADENDKGLLLGKNVAAVEHYSPEILYPIPRSSARESLGVADSLPFFGEDVWHAYEVSWLDETGKPQVRVGRITIPADSPNLVESKSIKLYLNSFNGEYIADESSVVHALEKDLSAAAGAPVNVALWTVDDAVFAGQSAAGTNIDGLQPTQQWSRPGRDILRPSDSAAESGAVTLNSHLLRSLCPVTGQPDWATVCITYESAAIDPVSLLEYIISFRTHQEFHEQCVERIFIDLMSVYAPTQLSVQALYTRRGGLDICPWRSTLPGAAYAGRMNRQ